MAIILFYYTVIKMGLNKDERFYLGENVFHLLREI